MALRGKYSLSLMMVVVLTFFVAPKAFAETGIDLIDDWLEQYFDAVEAVEAVQDDDDEDDDDELEPIEKMMVRIDDDIGEYAGVETLSLAAIDFFPEIKAQATVVDIRPMLALRARYNQAVSTLNVAKVVTHSVQQELTRLTVLSKGTSSVAAKKVNYAQANYNEKKAKLQGLRLELDAIKGEALQSFGSEISTWILVKNSKQWQRLVTHQDSLLLVTLPVETSMSEDVSVIRVAGDVSGKQARKAYFVSQALVIDPNTQGKTFFFKTLRAKLHIGMRLDAWIPQGNEVLQGVFIPNQAVVWNDGETWVYIQLDDNLYQRRSTSSGRVTVGGLFMEKEFAVGESLVVTGAQMLLSEEFRWQILDEDDD